MPCAPWPQSAVRSAEHWPRWLLWLVIGLCSLLTLVSVVVSGVRLFF